jgi:hypothetical protein
LGSERRRSFSKPKHMHQMSLYNERTTSLRELKFPDILKNGQNSNRSLAL